MDWGNQFGKSGQSVVGKVRTGLWKIWNIKFGHYSFYGP